MASASSATMAPKFTDVDVGELGRAGLDRGVPGVELDPDAERHVLRERDVPALALRDRNE